MIHDVSAFVYCASVILYRISLTSWPFLYAGYDEHAEAYNLVQQAGVWEVHKTNDSAHGHVIRQVVTQPPIDTCRPRRMPHPVAIIGNFNW